MLEAQARPTPRKLLVRMAVALGWAVLLTAAVTSHYWAGPMDPVKAVALAFTIASIGRALLTAWKRNA